MCIKGELSHRKVTVGFCIISVIICCLKKDRFLYDSIKDFTANGDLILRAVLWDPFHRLRRSPVEWAAPDTAFVWRQSSGAQLNHCPRAQALAVQFALSVRDAGLWKLSLQLEVLLFYLSFFLREEGSFCFPAEISDAGESSDELRKAQHCSRQF